LELNSANSQGYIEDNIIIKCFPKIPNVYKTNIKCYPHTFDLIKKKYVQGLNESLYWHIKTNEYKIKAIVTLCLCLRQYHTLFKHFYTTIINMAKNIHRTEWEQCVIENNFDTSVVFVLPDRERFKRAYKLQEEREEILCQCKELGDKVIKLEKEKHILQRQCDKVVQDLEQETRGIIELKKLKK
jgi:hypothetical protein